MKFLIIIVILSQISCGPSKHLAGVYIYKDGAGAKGVLKIGSTGIYDYDYQVDMFHIESAGNWSITNEKLILITFDSLTSMNGKVEESTEERNHTVIRVQNSLGWKLTGIPVVINGSDKYKTDDSSLVKVNVPVSTILVGGDYPFFYRIKRRESNNIAVVMNNLNSSVVYFHNEKYKFRKGNLISPEGMVYKKQ